MVTQKEPMPFIQRGTTTTDASGNISVTFDKEFVSTPIIILTPLHATENYQAIIRTRATTGFTGHVRKLAAQTSGAGSAHTHAGNAQTVNMSKPATTGSAKSLYFDSDVTPTQIGFYDSVTLQIAGSSHSHTNQNESAHTHSVQGDQAAGEGVTVHWIAIQP